MAGAFDISQEVERLNTRWIKCDDVVRESRGTWNDAVADHFIFEYWQGFEEHVPDFITNLINMNGYLKNVDSDI